MSNRNGKLAVAIAIAMLALPAAAGSRPNIEAEGDAVASLAQYRYFYNEEKTQGDKSFAWGSAVQQRVDTAAVGTRTVNGFEYIGGEGGWQPSQHKYVRVAGRFAHSDECDHVIRTAKAPTPAELESARKFYGGGA